MPNSLDTKVEDLPEEYISYSDDSLFNIISWGADYSFRELIMMYDENELLKPELQRKYVWDNKEASRFIDSILLKLPVPSVFLAKVGEKLLIIDGFQRIMTIYDFVQKGIFSGDGKIFKLSNSEIINERWRGLSYKELSPDEQSRIRGRTIHAIIFEQKTPKGDTGMYQIFERINTSGRTLKPQEIRNCVYQGKFNEFIMELNKKPYWRILFGSEAEDSRMTDVELILRFFFMHDFYNNRDEIKIKQVPLKKSLNEFMDTMNAADDDKIEYLKGVFERTMIGVESSIGPNAFRNISSKAFQPALFDAIGQAFAYVLNNSISYNDDKTHFINSRTKLLECEGFQDYIRTRTTNVDRIIGRIEMALEMLFNYRQD